MVLSSTLHDDSLERIPEGSLKEGSLKEHLKVISSIYRSTLLGFFKELL